MMYSSPLKSRLTILLCAAVLTCISAMRANAQSAPVTEDVWKSLRYKMGWISNGVLTADAGQWAAGEPGFEIVGNAWRARKPVRSIGGGPETVVLPKRGDRIRINRDEVLWILNFKISGEKDRLVSPTTRQRGETTDETGISLPRGSELIVREVRIGRPAGGLKGIWLRVSPP